MLSLSSRPSPKHNRRCALSTAQNFSVRKWALIGRLSVVLARRGENFRLNRQLFNAFFNCFFSWFQWQFSASIASQSVARPTSRSSRPEVVWRATTTTCDVIAVKFHAFLVSYVLASMTDWNVRAPQSWRQHLTPTSASTSDFMLHKFWAKLNIYITLGL